MIILWYAIWRALVYYFLDFVPQFWLRRFRMHAQAHADSTGHVGAYYLRGRKIAEMRDDGTLNFRFEA